MNSDVMACSFEKKDSNKNLCHYLWLFVVPIFIGPMLALKGSSKVLKVMCNV